MPFPPAIEAARPSIGDLTAAFRTLDRSSRRLEEAYRCLLERVQAVDRELVETNERLARKVEELDSLTRLLNDILAAMHSGVVAVDAEGRITSFNQAAERVLGVSADEVLGQPHEAAFRNDDGSASPLGMTLSTGQAIGEVEREVATRGGARLCLSSRVTPIRNAQGRVVGAVEVFSDLTEFRELQERLDRADKLAALGQMTAQVAHEVRNPLNSIEGFARLLVRDLDPDDRRRGFAAHIVTSARSLNKIVTNMLDFSQPFAVQARPVSLRELVEEALAFALEEARHRGDGQPEVQLDVDPDADAIEADPDLIRQALLNLLSNAVQAMPDGGTLRLAVASPDPRSSDLVALRIEDSGPGIPQALRERVLDPFFTTRTKGTGLGLAIVQKIARRHGGHLALDSAPGQGTTAVLTLPRRAAVPCDQGPQDQAAADPQPQTSAR
ncbi:MAG: two-component system sensor histidine kinase NtrB [Planctomycetota bacterium]